MSWLPRLWTRLRGQAPAQDPETATTDDTGDEEILVATRYNAATQRGRVITNISVGTASDIHSDLLTLPAPRDRTSAYAVALGLTLDRVRRRPRGSA